MLLFSVSIIIMVLNLDKLEKNRQLENKLLVGTKTKKYFILKTKYR